MRWYVKMKRSVIMVFLMSDCSVLPTRNQIIVYFDEMLDSCISRRRLGLLFNNTGPMEIIYMLPMSCLEAYR